MKRIISASLILLLAGCSTGSKDNESTSSIGSDTVAQSSVVESNTSMESTSSLPVESSKSEESNKNNVEGLETDESSSIRLYVPDTLREDEESDLFGEVIEVAEQFTTESAPLSEEGLFTLSYTGYYIENEEGNIQAYFIGVNRVGEPLSNLSFTLNFLVGETAVWDHVTFTLDESEFGVQPNQSAMPIFLDIPVGKEQILMDAKPEETFIEIKDLAME
ncbi:hypothetical protein LZ578_04320 [Jeotgalibaca sp. MA1X17-3]|uniref:hypothetical protein n=1 Tax=Jeotgalibaca sp. MA1X17-3 TaxID=2908211 RepID=UPI001F21CE70|nr:hypothetical protein [Jeotgalibaca sp. MA1X17-3]UJF16357.1 hypothetical protein LZ578_04320 [Jeotgalibaca sp. MA1X17-3]